MIDTIKRILKPVIPQKVIDIRRKCRRSHFEQSKIKDWKKKGCPVPPPHAIKQNTILEYQKKYASSVLIETGTFMGDMVEAQKKRFEKIISIELDKVLFENATERFKNDKNITIVQGDSGKVLSELLNRINEPAIFWLDGHYSSGITAKGDKECPIIEELNAIFDSKISNHVILIDDARCFLGIGDYPTIEDLTKYIKSKNEKYQIEVKHDIIRCYI